MIKKSFQVESSDEMSSENVNYEGSDSEDLVTEDDSDNQQSNDNDAPVGVSWKDSKAVFQQSEKNRNDAVNFVRSTDKAKRRKKNEMFVSQKEAKRKLTKLPEDIIQAVAKKPKQEEVKKIEEENSKKVKRRKANKNSQKKETEEYCHVVVILEDEVNKSKKVQESAAEFLKNHLYGNRIERTSGSKQLTMQSKSSGIIKPAVKFSNKV